MIKPFDPQSETVSDEIAEWARTPGVVGARIMLSAQPFEADDPGLNRILAAGGQAGIPVNVMSSGKLPLLLELARRHPDTQVVIDHVGLVQPPEPPAPPEPFADLDNVVSLAALENVAIKISGACTLSHQPFPYPDIWEPLGKVFSAFGFARCMWGTDWTRTTKLLTYEQGVEAFRVTDRLSDSERAALMGGTLAKIYNWSPDVAGRRWIERQSISLMDSHLLKLAFSTELGMRPLMQLVLFRRDILKAWSYPNELPTNMGSDSTDKREPATSYSPTQ